jgi:8-oxo-dGTP pyrophosphatase MutT (NUDIX family)
VTSSSHLVSEVDAVANAQSFPHYSESPTTYNELTSDYYQFRITGFDNINLGYVTSAVAKTFPVGGIWKLNEEERHLILDIADSDLAKRNTLVAESLATLRKTNTFKVLEGWRDELYPVYGPGRELILSLERSAAALLGVVTYGVHMTAFVRTSEGMKIWAPRRSDTKQTYPSMMDNTVAGGLSTGEKPFDCLIRECAEEASLPGEIACKAKACGTLTYFHVRDARAGGETGLLQPECQYIYDIELPEDVIPTPGDNEAVDFRLLSVDEVRAAMAEGRFKPNCALLLIEFLVRHGFITADEPDYIEIVDRCHRRLRFPMA